MVFGLGSLDPSEQTSAMESALSHYVQEYKELESLFKKYIKYLHEDSYFVKTNDFTEKERSLLSRLEKEAI